MGQYYKIVNIDKKEYFNPESLKLMEFSWVGNYGISKLFKLLRTSWKSDRVIIVGDYYSDDDDNFFGYSKEDLTFATEDGEQYFGFYHVDKSSEWKEVSINTDEISEGFFINEDTNQYVDLSKLISGYDNMVVSPTVLLACGNGRGGGDYRGSDEELIGNWAGCRVSFSSKKPFNKEEIFLRFKE
jgi:hypothetical protein